MPRFPPEGPARAPRPAPTRQTKERRGEGWRTAPAGGLSAGRADGRGEASRHGTAAGAAHPEELQRGIKGKKVKASKQTNDGPAEVGHNG